MPEFKESFGSPDRNTIKQLLKSVDQKIIDFNEIAAPLEKERIDLMGTISLLQADAEKYEMSLYVIELTRRAIASIEELSLFLQDAKINLQRLKASSEIVKSVEEKITSCQKKIQIMLAEIRLVQATQGVPEE